MASGISMRVWGILLAIAGIAVAQDQPATVRIERTSASTAVADAAVTVNERALRTDSSGLALTNVPFGEWRITVTKDGYFPATASLSVDTAREYVVRVELEPQETVKKEIRASVTCTDARIQDSPLHVEVIQREEIEEEIMMKPATWSCSSTKWGHARPDHLPIAWCGERARSRNARPLHQFPLRRTTSIRTARSRPWPPSNSAD